MVVILIVCGHEIGKWAIAMRIDVTLSIPAYALMFGVPARIKGWACGCGNLLPDDKACPVCERII